MEKLEHPLLIVDWVNALVAPLFRALGWHVVIPNYLVMCGIIVVAFLILGLLLRSRLSVENPSRFQIVLEDMVLAVVGILEQFLGSRGREFLPIIGTLGAFVLVGNYMGLIPGFMAPTSNINVTAACAVVAWVYYHLNGIRTQGVVSYFKHFMGPSGVPIVMVPIMLVVELISHCSRVLSLTLRLFGNIFGEELVILILGLIVPFFAPLPMMALGLVTGALQAFIFVLLPTIYLQGAIMVDHHDGDHAAADGHDAHAPHGHAAAVAA
ncbi:MAG: F0F1 ATP synthase subunit A [Acidobacteriota bacterium]